MLSFHSDNLSSIAIFVTLQMLLNGNRLSSPSIARVFLSCTNLKLIYRPNPTTSCQSHKPLEDLEGLGYVSSPWEGSWLQRWYVIYLNALANILFHTNANECVCYQNILMFFYTYYYLHFLTLKKYKSMVFTILLLGLSTQVEPITWSRLTVDC